MKSLFMISFAVLCIYSSSAISVPNKHDIRALAHQIREVRHPRGVRVVNGVQMGTQLALAQSNNGSDFLCEPCQHFFSVLKDVVGDVSDLTKDTLTNALNVTCKYLEGSVPFIDKVCEEFGPTFINILYNYLTEIDKEINPIHDCKLLLLCWGDKQSQKQAFQEMVLKNKIRFD